MKRTLISSGSIFENNMGYSRAVVQGDWVFVAGTTGFDYGTMTIADSIVEQTEQCLQNIEQALHECGAGIGDVVRVISEAVTMTTARRNEKKPPCSRPCIVITQPR